MSKEKRTPIITTGFATEPADLEKHIFLSSDGEDEATIGDFEHMRTVCKERGETLAIVIDAEGEYVCVAPLKIARLIAKLFDNCDEITS